MKEFPSNITFKKLQKANYTYISLLEKKKFFLHYGQFALQSLSSGTITFKQIESCRVTIKRGLKNQGSIYIRLFTGLPVTKKPSATRMGKGKGSTSY